MMFKSGVRSFVQRDLYPTDSVHPLNQLKKLFVRDIVYLLKNKICPGGQNLQKYGQNQS